MPDVDVVFVSLEDEGQDDWRPSRLSSYGVLAFGRGGRGGSPGCRLQDAVAWEKLSPLGRVGKVVRDTGGGHCRGAILSSCWTRGGASANELALNGFRANYLVRFPYWRSE